MLRASFVTLLVLAWIQAPTPQAVADDLLAADRAFAAAAAAKPAVEAITAMLADDVAMMAPPPVHFTRGRARAAQLLGDNADYRDGRVEWAPVRAGISADGQHGFTFGYMTLRRGDQPAIRFKYVAYWVKTRDGWRVAVYKRARAERSPASQDMLPPALPARLTAPTADAAALARYTASLDRAERAFSDDAQAIGLERAFARHGSPDAVNVGGPDTAEFVVGAEAIARAVSAGQPPGGSTLHWAPDEVLVASSGDLGVTFGRIFFKTPRPDGPTAVPYVTIWRRDGPTGTWRYVAE